MPLIGADMFSFAMKERRRGRRKREEEKKERIGTYLATHTGLRFSTGYS